jgi:hypothetical protein
MKCSYIAVAMLVALVSACRADAPPGFAGGDRRILDVHLDTAFVVLSALEDTILTFPRHAARASDGTVYVTDRGTKVVAFDSLGTLLWSYGRDGEGPEEFRNISGIHLHEDLLYLPDAHNNRIAVVSTAGEFQRYIFPAEPIMLSQMVRLQDGRIAALSLGRLDGADIVILKENGSLSATERIPLDGHTRLPSLASQGRLAQDGDQWVFAYSLADGWAMFDADSATGVVSRFIEYIAPPEVVGGEESQRLARPGAVVCTACGLSLSDSIVYVLFGGRTPENGAIMDLYDSADGGYLGSILLPDRAYGITVSDQRLVMLMHRPVPHLVTLNLSLPPLADLREGR